MTTEDEHKADIERLDALVAALGEFFDNVHIFVTKHETPPGETEQKTFSANRGTGNWHARYGQIKEWVVYEEERIRVTARHDEEADA